MRSLPLFHRIGGQRVIVLGQGPLAEPKRRLVRRAGGIVVDEYQRGIDEGARLAFIAHEDPALGAADALRLRAAGLLVNVVDQPDLCDFTTPSLLDRDPVLIAIGTGGASAGLAKHVRLRLEAILPANLGALAEALFAARGALRRKFPQAAERRRALDLALAERGPLDPLDEASAARLAGWLEAPASLPTNVRSPFGLIEFILTSDDPEDLTLRQARLLGIADGVIADPGVGPAILARARADAERLVHPFHGPLPEGLVVSLRRPG